MKRAIYLAILISLCSLTIAQEHVSSPVRFNKNSVYGTFGIGPMYGTLLGNYERALYQPSEKFLASIGVRVGVGRWVVWGDIGNHYIATFQVFSGKAKSHLEIGIGAVANAVPIHSTRILRPAGNLGYRFQKPGGVLLLRIGIGFPEALYLSLGLCF